MLASTGNVRRIEGFAGEGSIFLMAENECSGRDACDGIATVRSRPRQSYSLTSFPPNKDGDDYGGQHDFAEQERDEIVVLPQPSRGGLRNTGEP